MAPVSKGGGGYFPFVGSLEQRGGESDGRSGDKETEPNKGTNREGGKTVSWNTVSGRLLALVFLNDLFSLLIG